MAIPVWDLPTRLFHWLFVVLLAVSFVTGNIGGNPAFLCCLGFNPENGT